jgi:hypothetical protein
MKKEKETKEPGGRGVPRAGFLKISALGIAAALTMAATAQQPAREYPKPGQMSPDMTEFWTPQPPVVTPAPESDITAPPSDAVVLLGEGVNEFVKGNGDPVPWTFRDGILTCVPGGGMIQSKQKFGDCQLHVEWRAPSEVKGESQGRGNSGVFLADGLYEVQVLDSYQNETYANGAAGSIYKQSAPLVNPIRKPGEWNTYDIIYNAPVFRREDCKLLRPGSITVIFNGVLVQNDYQLRGTTEYVGHPRPVVHGKGSIKLQDHSNPVSFRNIWIRES